ncbi:MAG TPA: FAD binding domain-containing protein [Actinomycetota bacterium]
MKLPAFSYVAPTSLGEAVEALAAGAPDAQPLAGGQSLLPAMALGMVRPTMLVDLGLVPGLDALEAAGHGTVVIGAMARQRAVERHPELLRRCPAIGEAAGHVGSVPVRNRGTVGGSIANADPGAEWPCLLLALDGEVDATGPEGSRTIRGVDLYPAPFAAALAPGELLTEVRLRLPAGPAGAAFRELALRSGASAIVGVAAVLGTDPVGTVHHARVAVLNGGSTPMRADAAERVMLGRAPTDDAVDEAIAAVRDEVDPPGDRSFSAGYRRHLAGTLAGRALRAARDRIGGRAAW